MRQFLVLVLVGSLAAWVATSPVLAADREQQQIMADIRMLQEHTLRLELLLGTLAETLTTVLAKLDEQRDVDRRAFADQKLLVDNVAQAVRILREKVDDTNVRISSLSHELEALRFAIPPTSPSMTEFVIDPATGERFERAGPPAPTVPVGPGVSPQRMYDTAWADYTTGQWALAIQGFEAYIETFPRSELADNAQFYIGQTYFADGRFEDAVVAFDHVLAGYPEGDAVPEASYKLGEALNRLGEADRAKATFAFVVENYPGSTMAILAQQSLDLLSQPER